MDSIRLGGAYALTLPGITPAGLIPQGANIPMVLPHRGFAPPIFTKWSPMALQCWSWRVPTVVL